MKVTDYIQLNPDKAVSFLQSVIKYAEQDLRYARKSGMMTVVQTTVGNIDIEYTEQKTYIIRKSANYLNGWDDAVLYTGNKKGAIEKLVDLYDVIK